MSDLDQMRKLNVAKLEMLNAIARSQTALAMIMEHTATVATQYPMPVSLIREQLQSLAQYQSSMIAQLSGIRVRLVTRRQPTHRPWLNPMLNK